MGRSLSRRSSDEHTVTTQEMNEELSRQNSVHGSLSRQNSTRSIQRDGSLSPRLSRQSSHRSRQDASQAVTPPPQQPRSFKDGESVEAEWEGRWYPVEIKAANADGSFHVWWIDIKQDTQQFQGQLRPRKSGSVSPDGSTGSHSQHPIQERGVSDDTNFTIAMTDIQENGWSTSPVARSELVKQS